MCRDDAWRSSKSKEDENPQMGWLQNNKDEREQTGLTES